MRAKTGLLLVVILVLTIVQGTMQKVAIQPLWRANFATEEFEFDELSPDQLLVVLAGFREMIAGILWVRADKFFDTGNYDAILPIIRIVTMLDPNQIDVYATGMWHIAYNFTDEEQRSDRRYVPSALALGREGARRNPDTYELWFETGWLWYHKINDQHDKAVFYWEEAVTKDDMLTARKNLLPQAYLRNGQVEQAVDYFQSLLDDAQVRFDEAGENAQFSLQQNRDTIENNLDNLLVRMSQRGWFASQRGVADLGEYDIRPRFNVGFSARVTIPEPKVLQVDGTWNVLPVGTRIRMILRDESYPNAVPGGMLWDAESKVRLDPPLDRTFMQDELFVRNQRFTRRIDMSRDPTMYPFFDEKYVIEFYYSPREAPDHIQDKFGWNGEGMTDDNYIREDVREERVIFAQFELTREQILRTGQWAMGSGQVPIFTTKGYVDRDPAVTGNIIDVPGLRNPGTGAGAEMERIQSGDLEQMQQNQQQGSPPPGSGASGQQE